MEKLLGEIRDRMAVGSIVNSSYNFAIIFLEGPLAGDIADAVERLENNGYAMIQGIDHAMAPDRLGWINRYSATLRKK